MASRETLDHSAMYIIAVALKDGTWRHVDSYLPERAARSSTVVLWHSIEDDDWTARHHHPAPAQRAFGGRVVATFKDSSEISDELAVADAQVAPRGDPVRARSGSQGLYDPS